MKLNVYAVHDTLAGIYLQPCTGDSDPAMVRSFGDAVTKGDTPISQHPEDYCLERIGEYDNETGNLVGLPTPAVLCHGVDFVKSNKE